MRYEVTLRGQRGAIEVVHVEADSGDEAVAKAFKPFHIINSVQPAAPAEVDAPVRKPRAKKAA
jgi:hypothetical protein